MQIALSTDNINEEFKNFVIYIKNIFIKVYLFL